MSKVDINASTLQIAKNLIQRKSVTPIDAGCQSYMADYLRDLGFNTEHMDFGDTENIWSTRGKGAPCFVFAGHTDVVPPGNPENWITPAFEPTEVNGLLYGRGAADMKGSLAAMMTATRRFVTEFPAHKGTLAFLVTSDEEGPFINGTVKVVDELIKRRQTLDFALVGEPSSTQRLGDVIKIGRRGSLTGWLTTKGIQGHVAYPHLADNAIHRAASFILDLIAAEWDNGNEFFPPTSLQVTNFRAGEASNIVPGEAHIEFNLRYSTEQSADGLMSRIETLAKTHSPEFAIKWKLNGEPFLTQSHTLISAVNQAVQSTCGYLPSAETGGGTSDGRFIAKTGAQVVELGPINRTIHQVNECVAIDDLDLLSDIYYQILKQLLV
jgi:succinyl-diaminopimelate desuccinylase